MGMTYAYVGNATIGAFVDSRLSAAGFSRVRDVASAEVVLTYCTTGADLEDTYFEQDGIIKLADKGTLLVDLSPAYPGFARELSAIATVSDLRAVEAPLYVLDYTASDFFAGSDVFGCYLAGEDADVEQARPLVEAIASQVTVVDGCGGAQLAKAVHTIQAACTFVSAVESEALCRVVREVSNSVDGPTLDPEAQNQAIADAFRAIAEERFDGDY